MKMNNNITIHQSDERTFFLEKLLAKTDISFLVPTHVFAPNIKITSTTLEDVKDGEQIVCGRIDSDTLQLATERNIKVHSMLTNEKFQAYNSRLTAEGALSVIANHSLKSVSECYYLILGFGRTGAACARLLNLTGAKLDIATNSSLRPAHAFATTIVSLNELDFTPYDVVINTVPKPIVSDKDAMSLQQGAIYVDLASSPAINLEYARYLGVDADIYPALPAKVSPISAAKAMLEYIKEISV